MQPNEPNELNQPMTESQAEVYAWLKGMVYKNALMTVSNGGHPFVLIVANPAQDKDRFLPQLTTNLPIEGSKELVRLTLEHCYGDDAIVICSD